MAAKIIGLGLVLLGSACILVMADKPGLLPMSIVHLGTVDGRSYFYETGTKNWYDAKEHCLAANLELATVETEDQWDFFQSRLPGAYFYWAGLGGTVRDLFHCFGCGNSTETPRPTLCALLGTNAGLTIRGCEQKHRTLCQATI